MQCCYETLIDFVSLCRVFTLPPSFPLFTIPNPDPNAIPHGSYPRPKQPCHVEQGQKMCNKGQQKGHQGGAEHGLHSHHGQDLSVHRGVLRARVDARRRRQLHRGFTRLHLCRRDGSAGREAVRRVRRALGLRPADRARHRRRRGEEKCGVWVHRGLTLASLSPTRVLSSQLQRAAAPFCGQKDSGTCAHS